jgi:hypothetical protein
MDDVWLDTAKFNIITPIVLVLPYSPPRVWLRLHAAMVIELRHYGSKVLPDCCTPNKLIKAISPPEHIGQVLVEVRRRRGSSLRPGIVKAGDGLCEPLE